MKTGTLEITGVIPSMGVPGGDITILCRGFRPGLPSAAKVLIGDVEAAIASASEDRIIVRIADSPRSPGVSLRVNDDSSEVFPFTVGTRLAQGLHPVTNPVLAPDGSLITTISGSRGEQVEQPLLRVTRTGAIVPFLCEIMNPTGLAFGPDGQLYISSRNDGVVYRYRDFSHLETVGDDLGIPCGLAFDSRGRLFVGDRSGKIYRLDLNGGQEVFATIEPSVSAFHLAMDADDRLYVTGPTLSLRDSLYRISPSGDVEVLLRGLARPQGLAFMPDGRLLLASAYRGTKGIFRIDPGSGGIEHYIASPTMVGLAVSGQDIFLADNSSLFWIQPGTSTPQLL